MRKLLAGALAACVMSGSAGTRASSLSAPNCPTFTPEVEDAIASASVEEEALVRSIVHHESAGKVRAVSPAGAVGLMQVMRIAMLEVRRQETEMLKAPRPWTKHIAKFNSTCSVPKGGSLFHPIINVHVGSCYLLLQRIRYYGNVKEMVISYNGGHASVLRYRKGLPIWKETSTYLHRVSGTYNKCIEEKK